MQVAFLHVLQLVDIGGLLVGRRLVLQQLSVSNFIVSFDLSRYDCFVQFLLQEEALLQFGAIILVIVDHVLIFIEFVQGQG